MVSFHAHPDDECISGGGVMRAAADAGHRVVLVVATRGEHGEVADGVLATARPSAERRVEETHAPRRCWASPGSSSSATSTPGWSTRPPTTRPGRSGPPTSRRPPSGSRRSCATRTPRCSPLRRARRLRPPRPHPGAPGRSARRRARGHAPGLRGTSNRDEFREMHGHGARGGRRTAPSWTPRPSASPESESPPASTSPRALDAKRAAMRAHPQPDRRRLLLPRARRRPFALAFGTEWFIRAGGDPAHREDTLFPA